MERAIAGQLEVPALSDRDTVRGVGPAVAAASGRPLQIIPAVEMSSTFEGEGIHILGYFVDLEAEALARHARRSYERRAAGGIPVWAHPPAERFHELPPRLLDACLRGLEATGPRAPTWASPNSRRWRGARGCW
ncbi:MAG: hypothetical protein OXG58_01485 [Gemmatimonadetes bacterium]|nr:hypothetical protein [Gemmatimonadota bacterium]MCY3942592.1 hypothetical protein [Gemmatimonadota bacterium]